MKYTPVLQQGENLFIVPTSSMVGDSQDDAWKIAMGLTLVEGIILNFKFSGEYLELSDDGKATIKGWEAKLGTWDVVILDRNPTSPTRGE